MTDTTGYVGRQFGRYVLEEFIGQGGMSTVFRAYDPDLDRRVAFKILAKNLTADTSSDSRFVQEARIVAKLAHHNIAPIYDYGEAEGIYYIVMRLLAGGSLEDYLVLLRKWQKNLADVMFSLKKSL